MINHIITQTRGARSCQIGASADHVNALSHRQDHQCQSAVWTQSRPSADPQSLIPGPEKNTQVCVSLTFLALNTSAGLLDSLSFMVLFFNVAIKSHYLVLDGLVWVSRICCYKVYNRNKNDQANIWAFVWYIELLNIILETFYIFLINFNLYLVVQFMCFIPNSIFKILFQIF